MTAAADNAAATGWGNSLRVFLGGNHLIWLVLPAFIFFLLFFMFPVLSLLAISFNKAIPGIIDFQFDLTLANFERFFKRAIFYEAAIRSIGLATLVAGITLIIGYPLAYLIAKTEHPGRNTFLMILVLTAMQLDMVIRLYGLMVLMGDNGLINAALLQWGVIETPLPLMYNFFGVVVGLTQFTLPFMVLSLIGIVRGIHPSLEEAARSLGAGRFTTFRRVTLPIIKPGIIAGSLLCFIISFDLFAISLLLKGIGVVTLPIQLFDYVRWDYDPTAAAVATVSILITLVAIGLTEKLVGLRSLRF